LLTTRGSNQNAGTFFIAALVTPLRHPLQKTSLPVLYFNFRPERRESARQAGGLAMTIRPPAAYCCKEEIARGRV
jgi:hypothetical protein